MRITRIFVGSSGVTAQLDEGRVDTRLSGLPGEHTTMQRARGYVLVALCALMSASLHAQRDSLWSAARDGNLENVQAALADGADVDARAEDAATALFFAAEYGHAAIVGFLAEQGADVNVRALLDVGDRAYRVSALGAAALRGYADVVRTLLNGGAPLPEYVVGSDRLSRFASSPAIQALRQDDGDITGGLRDWEIIASISANANPVFRPGNMGDTDTVADQSEHVWKVYGLDRLTGELLWERTAHRGVPRAGRHLKSTFANATPVTDGEYVVVFFGSEGLYCYDMDGTLVWQKDFGIVGMPAWGFASSPIIYGNLVIIQSDTVQLGRGELPPAREAGLRGQRLASNSVAAFDLADGSERWRTARHEVGSSFGTPTIATMRGRAQFITNGGARIRGYDPLTGRELWSLAARTRKVTPTPVVAHDLIQSKLCP